MKPMTAGQLGRAPRSRQSFRPRPSIHLAKRRLPLPGRAWVSKEKLANLTKQQRREFLRLAPEFVVEVMSPSDRLRAAQQEMDQEWMANGVELGWLIDADSETVHVYRQRRKVEAKKRLQKLAGEGPVKGFDSGSEGDLGRALRSIRRWRTP